MKHKICHLTSAHPRYDTRIFIKECQSLAEEGYEVSLVVADGKRDEVKNNIYIHDVGKKIGRLKRMLFSARDVYKKALEIDADIYHAHDPELLPYCLKLRKKGKKVIFDAHEDLPVQIKSKHYLNNFTKEVLSKLVARLEKLICKRLDGIVAATPLIEDKFKEINPNTVNVSNFPLIEEIKDRVKWEEKKNEIVYIGGISKIRGIQEIIAALKYTDGVCLNLAGNFIEKDLEEKLKASEEWEKVNELGYINREGVAEILNKSKIGLVTLYPQENYKESLPVKMFEYMNAGIPVIASNFPYWKKILSDSKCGVCVDPLDSKEIGNTINELLNDNERARKMGEAGYFAVQNKYNWKIEAKKLIMLYKNF